jgi:hypothetical protein
MPPHFFGEFAMPMADMKISKTEAKEHALGIEMDTPEYPYGLSISLEQDQLEKLGITDMPKVGAKMMVHANAVVKTVSAYDTQNGSDKRVELQITEMELVPGEGKDPAEIMYGKG